MTTITGTNAANTLTGTTEDDVIEGLGGIDTIRGGAGDDELSGQGDRDFIFGEAGSDRIYGGSGDDVIYGDEDFALSTVTDTVSGTLVNGNPVTVSLTGPNGSTASSERFTGFIGQTVTTGAINIAYVIDLSGSMGGSFAGSTVGDVNGDGSANTLLDAAIASYIELNATIIDAGFGFAEVQIIGFSNSGVPIGLTVRADADTDQDGETDVEEALRSLTLQSPFGGGTDFEDALISAITFFNSQPAVEADYLYFLSDGFGSGSFLDEVATLESLGVVRSAVGLGTNSDLSQLNQIDSNGTAQQVTDPTQLTAALLGSPVDPTDVTGVQIFVNGTLEFTIPPSALNATPLGLTFAFDAPLDVGSDDIVQARVVFADGSLFTARIDVAEPQAGDDLLDGGTGDDALIGGLGDDELCGRSGADNMYGGGGEDRMFGGADDDNLFGGRDADHLDGGSGFDYARYDDSAAGVYARLDTGLGSTGDAAGDTFVSIEGLVGSQFRDIFVGNDVSNTINGLGGNDQMFGQGGDDMLIGGAGDDEMQGGLGNDSYYVDSYLDAVVERVGEGSFDQVYTSTTYALAAGAEIERLATTTQSATTAITLTGNEFSQQLLGNDGANTLIGGAGIDSFIGYGGNDIYVVDNAAESITEIAGQGSDSVYTSVSFTLATGLSIERLVAVPLSSTDPVNLTGNEIAQVVAGNNGVNVIYGAGGNDSLYGYGGNDYIEGAQGNDSLFGGTGVDRFIFRESLGSASGIDRIYDMTSVDNIVVDANAVSALTSLTANQFWTGTAAHDADDRIIYDATSGAFWFDPDGTGAQAAILFGVINGAPGGVDHTWFELM